MSRKRRIYRDSPNCHYQYTNWLNFMINMIQPKNMFAVMGRGTGKTTDILADRVINVMYDMPRAKAFFSTDTYVHALSDIMPALLRGLELKGLVHGRDFVTDERPPSHWASPLTRIFKYNHTISFKNGFYIKTVSMDEPSSMAGDSYQHGFGDEVKYQEFKILKNIFPALRGDYLDFSPSPYYGGLSFTTDMPNITNRKEFDWILDRKKGMNPVQIKYILAASITLNDIREEYIRAFDKSNTQKMEVLQKRIEKWEIRHAKLRKNSTLFLKGSSFINSLLDVDFYKSSLDSLGEENFNTAVLSLEPELNDGEKFYINLGEHHYYKDGIKNEFYNNYKLTDTIVPSSEALRYIKNNEELECGVDFGNMCSMVTGQTIGNYAYALKEFYTLPPDHTKELAGQFKLFYRNHNKKILHMFYDRAGNQYKNVQKDFASELKRHIEYDDNGNSTGWKVILESLNQKTIYQDEEYGFMSMWMSNSQTKIPTLLIDYYQCKCLRSSLSLTKIKISKDNKGRTRIKKNKTSEKLPMDRLPEYSTNFSDAFKYWAMRKKWVNITKGRREITFSDPMAH